MYLSQTIIPSPAILQNYGNSIIRSITSISNMHQSISQNVNLLVRDEQDRSQFFAHRLESIEKQFHKVVTDLSNEDDWMKYVIEAQLHDHNQDYVKTMDCFQRAMQVIPDDPFSNMDDFLNHTVMTNITLNNTAFTPSNNRSTLSSFKSHLDGIEKESDTALVVSRTLLEHFSKIKVSDQSEIAASSHSTKRLSNIYALVNEIIIKMKKEESWIGHIKNGQKLHIEGKYDLAEQQFTFAINTHPEDPLAYCWRGITRLLTNPSDARLDFEFVVSKIPQDVELHRTLAIMYHSSQDFSSALQHLSTGILFSDLECRILRGKIYLQLNRLDEALRDFNDARSATPGNRLQEIEKCYSEAIFKKYSVTGDPALKLPAITNILPNVFSINLVRR